MNAAYPLAVAFLTPAFLAAGAILASIPIIIHLLNRRRYRVVRWAAMEYLLQAMKKNRRRLRFEHLLLLVVRCSLLGLLGLALARPLGCGESSLLGKLSERNGVHVFIIDNGYSMAYEADRPGAKTHLEQAKLMARQLIDRLAAGGESVAVVTTSSQRKGPGGAVAEGIGAGAVIEEPTYDLVRAKEAIDRIEQSYGPTDTAGALQVALSIAKQNERTPRKLLYILTDGTRSAWGEQTRGADAVRQAGREIAGAFGAPLFFNLGKPDQWNFAVQDLKPSSSLLTTRFLFDLVANLGAFGSGGGSTQLQWKIDGQPAPGGESITLDQPSVLKTLPNNRLTEGGPHMFSASLIDDERLKIDNTRWKVADVASEMKVLIVEGNRDTKNATDSSGAFLSIALAPPKDSPTAGGPRSDSYVAPDLISESEMNRSPLDDYKAIILTDVPQVQATEAERLEKFVKDGGTLMLFMGEQVMGEVYNRNLLPRGLMPGKLITRKTDASADAKGFTFDFNPEGNVHPALREFQKVRNSGLGNVRVNAYYQCEIANDAKVDVVLRYLAGDKPTNDPAITIHDLGKGRVVFFSTTANGEWTTFLARPAYVALMHELLQNSVRVGDDWMNLTVGQPVLVPPALRLTAPPKLTDGAGRELLIEPVDAADGQMTYRSVPLTKPGEYKLVAGKRNYPIAVNVPADEADIRVMDATQLRKSLGDIEVQFAADALPSSMGQQEGSDLGWAVMTLVLALAGLECLLAMRFGHHRKAAPVIDQATTPATVNA